MYFQTRTTSVKSFFLYSQIYGVDIGLLFRDVFEQSVMICRGTPGGELAKIVKHGFPEATGAGVGPVSVFRDRRDLNKPLFHFGVEARIIFGSKTISIYPFFRIVGKKETRTSFYPPYHCISVPTHWLQKKV